MKRFFFVLLLALAACNSEDNQEVITPAVDLKHGDMGTRLFVWKDQARIDSFYGGNRIVNVQVWYPGDFMVEASEEPVGYYPGIDTIWENLYGWSEEDVVFVDSIKTHAYLNQKISDEQDQWPVLLLSPGLGMHTSLYTYQAEYLAARGFVVVGINHLYESEFVVDETGIVHTANHAFHDSMKTLSIPDEITGEDYRRAKTRRCKVLADDLLFVLDQLKDNNDEFFDGRLDFDKVGAFGHSIGGCASVYAALLTDQIKAVVDLDGTPPSMALDTGMNQPFMFIEDLTDYRNHEGYAKLHQRREGLCEKIKSDSYRVLIPGITHQSFADIHLHSATTPEEKERSTYVLTVMCEYMDNFFSHYMMMEESRIDTTNHDSIEVYFFPAL